MDIEEREKLRKDLIQSQKMNFIGELVSALAHQLMLVDATADGFVAPKVLIDAIKAYRYENRDINYILLTNANIDPVKAPEDDVLKAWFETAKARYRAPEYRSFSYVKLEPSDIADPKSITDEQVA